MPLTPQVTVTCNLQEITGNPGTSKITYELVNFGETVPRVSGTAVIVQTNITATADVSGNTSVTLWGLDVITPSGCFYTVTFYNEQGGIVATLAYNAFVGTGSFDLSQVVPMGQQVVAAAQPNSATPQVFTPLSHQFLTGMNSVGVFSSARPSAADLSDTATVGNVLRGNGTSFVSAVLSFGDLAGTVTAAQLPLPTASTLGGVKSLAGVAHNFLTSIGTNGLPVAAQPAFSDIGGTVAASQLPNPSATTLGGIESLAAQSSKWINAISTLGVPSATQPAFTDISGTASTGQIPNLSATIITSGLLALAHGGTNADLSATGAAHQVLKQSSVGAAITVGQLAAADLSDTATTGNVLRGNGTSFVSAILAASDLSNGVTGSGAVVLANTPTLITPVLGVATATSINKVAVTAPATSATLTIANGKTLTANNSLTLAGVDGKTLTVNNTLTFAGTDSTTLTFQGTGTVVNRDSTDTITNKTVGAGGLAGLTPKFQLFTASGTFTVPTGVTTAKTTTVGGGGAGGGSTTGTGGGGGGGGGTAIKWLSGLTPGNTLTVTIGAGGTGVSNASGGAGGNSTITSGTQTISTITGSGGAGGTSTKTPGDGGTSSGGDINATGQSGTVGVPGSQGGTGGGSMYGGGARGAFSFTGVSAGLYGAGGGGSSDGTFAGGNGSAGIVIFEWVI